MIKVPSSPPRLRYKNQRFRCLEDILAHTRLEEGPLDTPCMIWLGYINPDGYGKVSYDGVTVIVSRLVYELKNNIVLAAKDMALHRCDIRPCINPDHLEQGNARINRAHAVERSRLNPNPTPCPGESNGNAVLTEEDVLEIRRLYSKEVPNAYTIADMFGVSQGTIWHIVNRRTWKHI